MANAYCIACCYAMHYINFSGPSIAHQRPLSVAYHWRATVSSTLLCCQIDLETARTDVTRPECSLNIQPCELNGTVISTVAPVTPLVFSAIQPLTFELGYVGCPATNLVRLFNFHSSCFQTACVLRSAGDDKKHNNGIARPDAIHARQPLCLDNLHWHKP